MRREDWIEEARALWAEDELQLDDDAEVSEVEDDDGVLIAAWVQAWVLITNPEGPQE